MMRSQKDQILGSVAVADPEFPVACRMIGLYGQRQARLIYRLVSNTKEYLRCKVLSYRWVVTLTLVTLLPTSTLPR